MNPLEFELVASVVVVAVVLDLVSIPGAHVLVVVLVHLVSSVVLLLGEIAVVVDPCVIAVSMVATRTVMAHVVFAVWGGRGRRRCPHSRCGRSRTGFP